MCVDRHNVGESLDYGSLPKVHYSWPVPLETMSDELLFEYVRLTCETDE